MIADKNRMATRNICASLFLALTAMTLLNGCGGGSSSSTGTPVSPPVAPAISVQPVDQSIPMGLGARFTVTATGSSLQYQWRRNGATIAGATGASYLTPPTAFADTGSSFTVTVSNSVGSIESTAATLTVTARAPRAGDLRFRLVADPTTVYGYGNAGTGLSTNLIGALGLSYDSALGTPFQVGTGGDCGTPPLANGAGCAWFFSEVPLAASTPDLITAYRSDTYSSFQSDLQAPSLLAMNQTTPISSSSVINALDMEPASEIYALGWMQSATQTGFDLSVQTVDPDSLPAAATQAGANSRVITAISNNGGQVTFVSYGWQSDPSTIYEVQVVSASAANAPTAAAGLAAQGYIITATGQADAAGAIYLVGTRVQGDTMPRPFIIAQSSAGNISPNRDTMMPDGYAIVGNIFNLPQGGSAVDASYTLLGER